MPFRRNNQRQSLADRHFYFSLPIPWKVRSSDTEGMAQSVWPYDHAFEDSYGVEKALDELRVFVICPAKPPDYWDELFTLISSTCNEIGARMGVTLTCRRAVDIISAGIIHPEIWRDIRSADVVIADITGCNGNVMFELGVAAAWLDKERVIIVREDRLDEQRLFDINPARQVDYTRSPLGFHKLANRLAYLMQDSIARAPFELTPKAKLALPTVLDLTAEKDCRNLWGPSGAHRRIIPGEGLEFGSLYNFRYGWLSVGDLLIRNVRVSGEFRFSSPRSVNSHQPWIGVMLRSQGYFASSGHLALLRANGEVAMTQEVDGRHERDIDIGKIDGFDAGASGFVPFDVSIDEKAWTIQIGGVSRTTAVADIPTVFSEGRIVVEGQFCWMCLHNLRIERLD